MALTSAALIRGLLHIDLGSDARHVGHVLLCRFTQSLKQSRQKLCWQGACGAEGCELRGGRGNQLARCRGAPSPACRTCSGKWCTSASRLGWPAWRSQPAPRHDLVVVASTVRVRRERSVHARRPWGAGCVLCARTRSRLRRACCVGRSGACALQVLHAGRLLLLGQRLVAVYLTPLATELSVLVRSVRGRRHGAEKAPVKGRRDSRQQRFGIPPTEEGTITFLHITTAVVGVWGRGVGGVLGISSRGRPPRAPRGRARVS